MNTYFKHTVIYLLGKGLPGVISFISIFIFSRLLSPEEYGNYSIILSIVGVLNILLFQWLRFGVSRYYSEYQMDNKLHQLFGLVKRNLIVFVGIALLLVLGLIFTNLIYPIGYLYTIIAVIALLFLLSTFEMFSQIFVSALQPHYYSISNLIKSIIALGAGVFLVKLGYSYYGVIGGICLAYLTALVFGITRLDFKNSSTYLPSDLRKFIAYGLPLTAASGINYVLSYSDRFMVQYYKGAKETGLYTLGFDFSEQSVGVILGIITVSSFPITMRLFQSEGKSQNLQQHLSLTLWVLLSMCIPICILLSTLNLEIGQILFGPKFAELDPLLIPVISFSVLVLGLKANLLDQILQFSNATKTMLYILVLAALLNVVLNYFFIQRMGYMGAAIATLIAYTFSTILTFIISRKYFRFVIEYKHLLKLLLASAFMYLVLELMPVSNSVWELIIKSGVGFFTFLIVLYFTNQSYILQIVKNFNKQ